MAELFGQAATQAPHPMHAAASNARSALRFWTGTEWASGADPVLAPMKPPAWMIRSNAERSTTRSRITGKAVARHGSTVSSAPSEKDRMCSWQEVVTSGPWGWPLMTTPHCPQMPSRQSLSKATGSSPEAIRVSLSTSSTSRKDMSSEMSSSW